MKSTGPSFALSLWTCWAAVCLAGLTARGAANVTLQDNNNGTVTMANGLVSMTFGKSGGDVSSFSTTVNPSVNLIDSGQDYALSLTHIGSGTNDWWVSIPAGYGSTYTVITNTGQFVDVEIRNTNSSGNTALFPNGVWDWSEHHAMRAGEAGFYTYHVWRHWANQPAAYYDADSWQGRMSTIFTQSQNADGSVNNAWEFSGSDVPPALSIGNVPNSNSDGVPGEVEVLPVTNFWTQPTGTNYEPGWPAYTQPTGLTSYLQPTWTKYDYSAYMGASNSFRPVWGVATDQVGVWSILASFEHMNGGPTKQKGGMSGNYMYNDDFEGHGLGNVPNPGAAAGEVFSKMIGPFFMYANTGTNHMQLWQDAQNEAGIMVSNWPYAWVEEPEYIYPRHRGAITGTIKAKTGEPTANAVVVLANASTPDWILQGVTNYLFWTTADTNGNFSIPKIRPDKYVLFSYVPGIWGEMEVSNIVVGADQTNNLGIINWNPPHLAQRLWRVGTPDHSSKEFHLGNYPKQFGLWWRYLNDLGQSNLNFTIGQSVESNDWYYAQCIVPITPQSAPNLTDVTQTNGTYWGPVWNIIFNLTNLPSTSVLCTVALAGGNGCYFYPYINGVNQTPNISGFSNPSQGVFTTDGVDIYRDVVTTGRYQYYQFTFPTSDFVVGTNTFSIHIRQPGSPGTWSNMSAPLGYPNLLQGGLIYDFLQMEAGPQVIMSSPPAAPGGLTATAVSGCEIDLVWTNNATNATSVALERSTDGVNFYQVTALAQTGTNYADTDLPPGTTYYYRVFANNVDGNSPFSTTVHTATQAAQPPAAPGGLTATAISTNQINLVWINNSTNEDGFNLESSTNGGNYSSMAMLAAGVTNYAATGLNPATTYYFRVQSFRACWGTSAFAAPASAVTLAPPLPVTPVGLVAIPGNTQVKLTWLTSAGASSYNVKSATVSGGPYTTLAGVGGTSYTNTSLVNGTTYYYVVSAVNAGGQGNNSREVSATPMVFTNVYWTNLITSAAQSWDTNANWTNTAVYPNAPGVVVNMTAAIAAEQTNNVDQNVTLGWLNLGAANSTSVYQIVPNGGTLTFANGTNNNAGLVELATSAGDTLAAPVMLSNNLTVVNYSGHALTLAGTIAGTNSLTYVGPGSFLITTNNTYSGNTLISGATVTLGNFTANVSGLGAGTVTLDQGTLTLNSDNNSPSAPFSNIFYWNLMVPTNSTGWLNGDGRCYLNGTLTGGGTLNYNSPYVRMELDGNWSAFTGVINASDSDFRVNNTYGLANAALALNGNSAYSLNGSLTVGEISGNASSSLTTTAWTVGARNTTATFAGIITGNSITKVGTGTWILTGANTYTGTTTISEGTLQIGAGGGSGSLGTGAVTDNALLVYNYYGNTTCPNLISGSGGLAQSGEGVLFLSAANTYSGPTFITAGTLALTNSGAIGSSTNLNLANYAGLDVSGTTAGSMTLASGKTMTGDGWVKGNFTVASGATLAPGNNDLGMLTFSNALTLNAGSRTILNVSHNSQTNNVINVVGAFTWGGSLVISNADAPLQSGDTFTLFNAPAWAGNFNGLTLPVLTPGLYWITNAFRTTATLVVGQETPPNVDSVNTAGGKLVLTGSGGVTNGSYYVLTSTNLAAPLTNWTRLLTNQFDGNGNFNFTNMMPPHSPQSFYLLQLP
jgi:autotransporter-associated beta strand protein